MTLEPGLVDCEIEPLSLESQREWHDRVSYRWLRHHERAGRSRQRAG